MRLLNLSDCFACKKRIWDHLIVSEDMDSIGEVESIIRALDNLRLIRSRSIYVLCCVLQVDSFGFVTSVRLGRNVKPITWPCLTA